MTADAHLRRGTIAVVLDVDGVVTPVNGASAWGDDVYAGDVFGPVHVSSSLVTRLDKLHAMPGVQCWWLTSWTSPMRAGMDPFPGPSWPMVADPEAITSNSGAPRLMFAGRAWWKWEALQNWLPQQDELAGLVWCEDHLRGPDETWLRHDLVRQQLKNRSMAALLIGPETNVGLTPSHLDQIVEWVSNIGRSAT